MTDLHASTEVRKTLEEEASLLTEKRARDQETLLHLNEEMAHSKNLEHEYKRHLVDFKRNKEQQHMYTTTHVHTNNTHTHTHIHTPKQTNCSSE